MEGLSAMMRAKPRVFLQLRGWFSCPDFHGINISDVNLSVIHGAVVN
jgi:hypothetical protein